jgi:hypothetical protein
MGFKEHQGEEFSYFVFSYNGITLWTTPKDEPLQVHIENSDAYWNDLDSVSSMIAFLKNTQID